MARARPPECAFTLVQLLIVIAIFVVLLAILVPWGRQPGHLALVRKTQITINVIAGGCEQYYNDFKMYPLSNPRVGGYSGFKGSEWLVQALTGYLDTDNQRGYGFRLVEGRRVYGPYNDCDKLPMAGSGTGAATRYEFIDAFDKPILYYAWMGTEYDEYHNQTGDDPDTDIDPPTRMSPPNLNGVYLRGPGGDYFRKDFVLISRGPDRRYDPAHPPYHNGAWDRECDDVTNFMSQ